jgi:cytochrome P450
MHNIMIATTTKKIPKLNLLELWKSRSDRFGMLAKSPSKFPKVFGFKVPGRDVVVVNNHEMVQHILVRNMHNFRKDHGYKVMSILLGNGLITNTNHASWRKQRTLLQPPFHRESLQNMCNIVADSTGQLLQRWKAKEGAEINFTQEMAKLTIDIVCRTLFTSNVTDEQINMVWKNLNFMNELGSKMAMNPLHIPFKYPLPRYNKGRKSVAALNDLIYGIINKRKTETNPPRDLLQLLMEAKYEDGSSMTDEQIRDEVITVFLAGHETTVNALSWTWYLLKQHPAAEQKLHEESAPFASKNPGFFDIPNLKYGYGVMNESMRVYPPVPAIGRAAVESEEVNGYFIKANTIMLINITGLHHHPAYWENPFEFNPERFENFDLKGENRFIFMPFGAGPHICIGNNFAMMEMQLINAIFSARVEMELVSKNIEPEPLITLKPGDGVVMKIKKVI